MLDSIANRSGMLNASEDRESETRKKSAKGRARSINNTPQLMADIVCQLKSGLIIRSLLGCQKLKKVFSLGTKKMKSYKF